MEDVAMAAFTYPGVYIEEVSSGQHTISGVATSIAAFVGWTNQGPVGSPTMIESWPQYEAQFGGFIPGNYLGYAVYQFFSNGGSQAYIVRLVDATATTAGSLIGGLYFYANSPGVWGNGITVSITNAVTTGSKTIFNLKVLNASGQTLESYTNLSTASTDPTYALTVINNDSNYISFTIPGQPTATSLPMTIDGSLTTGTFTAGELVTSSSGATATLVVPPTGSNPMMVENVSGVPGATDTWKDGGTAEYTATSVPAVSVSNASATLGTGTESVSGSDGTVLVPNTAAFTTALTGTNGYQLLGNVPIFNILCVPGENDAGELNSMVNFCQTYRAFMIVDADQTATTTTLKNGPTDFAGTSYTLDNPSYAGFYYPWIQAADPGAAFRPALFPPCGYVAGVFASTDANRGVWKAPAGIQATLGGSLGLQLVLNDIQNGDLNPHAVNCLRQFPVYGNVVWGARTMDGDDAVGSQYKYTNLRRLANFIESSLYQGTQWVVFEPNAEPLWGQVRLSIGTFMQQLFLQGAFAGSSRQTAYFVKCDADNNPDSSIALGIVNITVGFKPLDPAEFVVIHITQILNS
jgi:phage tail sheath protein FI